MFGPLNILAFVLGTCLLQQQASLPDAAWAGWLLPLGVIVRALVRFRTALLAAVANVLVWILFLAAGFYWAAIVAHWRMSDTLPPAWERQDIEVIGVAASVPHHTNQSVRFYFDIERVITEGAFVPKHVALSWYKGSQSAIHQSSLPLIKAGERWQLTVRLRQPHGNANPHGFDYEAWALQRNIRATGYVRSSIGNRRLDEIAGQPAYWIESIREKIQRRFSESLADQTYAGVLKTLATGDQQMIPREQWQIFTRTGTSHLMAISGLHITMISGMMYALVFWLWRHNAYLTLRLPAHRAAVLAGWLIALAYAVLSGFAIPAQRAVCMLTVVAVAVWKGRHTTPAVVLAWALFWVVLLDPWATIVPGFWLSFSAVAIIMLVTAGRIGKLHWLSGWLRIQWAITLGLIPLLLVLFQQFSLISPVANAIAIPLISLVVVPLTLLATVLPLDFLLPLAHGVLAIVMQLLHFLSDLPRAVWWQHTPPLWTAIAAAVGILWMLLPGGLGFGLFAGFPARWLGFIALLPLFLLQPEKPRHGELWLTVLDVGQGLAAVAQTGHHALLFDAGPKFGDTDSGQRVVLPYLHGEGIQHLDAFIVSHADSDHSGGGMSVLQGIPVKQVIASINESHPIRQYAPADAYCQAGQFWEWDGVYFEILHPQLEDYSDPKRKTNRNSCVLKITTAHGSVLLPADIESKDEQALLARSGDNLAATVLIAPHHGSRTSSTEAFVRRVNPALTIFTVGYLNRYGHPNSAVTERYRDLDSRLLRSDRDGAILLRFENQRWSVESWRKLYRRYWHQRLPELVE